MKPYCNLCAVIAAFLTVNAPLLPVRAQDLPTPALLPGTTQQINLAADAGTSLAVDLPQGSVAYLRLTQRQGFVDLQLQDATGQLLQLRTESGTAGSVRAPLLAAQSAHWLVTLRNRPGKGAASAALELTATRPAAARDALAGSAFVHYVAAERLRYQNYRETAAVARPVQIDERTQAEYAGAEHDYAAAEDGCGLLRTRIGLARTEVARGHYTEARAISASALEAACDGDLAERAQALKTSGMAAAYQGDFAASAQAAEQALALYRQTGELRYQGVVLGNLSDVYMQLGETSRALEAARGALEAAVSTADRQGVVFSQKSIAAIYLARGEFASALQEYRRTLSELAQTPYPMIEAETWNDLGILYHRMADYPQSRQSFATAQRVWRSLHSRAGHADTLLSEAQMLLEAGDTGGSLRDFAAALAIARADRLRSIETGALRGLGLANLRGERLDTAQRLFAQSLQLARATGQISEESYALRALAEVDYRRGALGAAQARDEQSLQLARDAADRDGEAATLAHLARILADRGELAAARSRIEQAIAHIETERGRINDPSLRTSYFAAMRPYPDTQIEILMRLDARFPGQGYAAAALAAAEQARARSLQDMLAEKSVDVSGSLEPALAAAQRRAEEELNAAAVRLARVNGEAGSQGRQGALREFDAASEALDRVRGQIRGTNPRYADLLRPAPLRLEELQSQLLDADSAILEYWLGERASYLWIVTQHSFRSLRLPQRALLQRLSGTLEALCRTHLAPGQASDFATLAAADARQRDAIHQAAQRLAHTVLGAQAMRGLPRRLAIVADAGLQRVAFGLLPADGAGTTLGATHDLAYLPSITTLQWLRRLEAARTPRPAAAAVFAAPAIAGADLAPLPYSREEAADIAALLPPADSWLALDTHASRAAALSADWTRFTIAHFATHAIIDRRRPELSGIVLSPPAGLAGSAADGVLRINDIYGLQMPVDLVVLSGCETAAGRDLDSEGIFSLSRAFFYAGAPRVVASLWPVEDRATAAFMHEFYRALLREHNTAAGALRLAQQHLAGDSRWAAPYYWAGFVLQGDWN